MGSLEGVREGLSQSSKCKCQGLEAELGLGHHRAGCAFLEEEGCHRGVWLGRYQDQNGGRLVVYASR